MSNLENIHYICLIYVVKKILLLTQNFPPSEGGSCRWFWELYSRIPKEQVVVVADCVEGFESFDKSSGLEMARIPLFSEEWGFKSLKGLKFYFKTFLKVKRLIKQHAIDEIHCGRVIHEGVIAWLLKVVTGIPFKCFVHGEDVETAATSREQSVLVRQVCKAATMLICNSNNSLNIITNKLSFADIKKCRVLHPGVDITRFTTAPRDSGFRELHGWSDKTVLLTVGRLQQRKGQDFLIKAMPALLASHPDLHYAIVGRGECQAELRQLIKTHKLEQHVTLHTDFSDEQLLTAYQQCNVFILPNRTIDSDIEGFGMVLVEAQSCGKFVIAGDSGGTKETMLRNETGFIINCSESGILARQLDIALRDPILLSADHTSIRQFVIEHFSWDSHIKNAWTIGLFL